jgi:hypothetical protein
VLADGIGEGGVFDANNLSCVGEVVVRTILLFPYLNLFNRGVSAAAVCVTDVSRFEEADVVYGPHELLLVGELDVGERGVLFVEGEVGSVLSGAGEEGTAFGVV